MQVIAEQQAVEAEQILDRLLGTSRLMAEVSPVLRDVKRTGRSRERIKKEPTGDYVVSLFAGGKLPIEEAAQKDSEDFAAQVNESLTALVRAAVEVDRQEVRRLCSDAVGVAGLKKARALLGRLRAAGRFGVRLFGTDIIVSDPSAAIYFGGDRSHERATKFATAVNKYLRSLAEHGDRALRERLTKILEQL